MAREYYASSLRHLQRQPFPKRKDRDDEPPRDGGDNTPRYMKCKWIYVESKKTPVMLGVKDDCLRLAPVDEIRNVELFLGDDSKIVRIGARLEAKMEEGLIAFLQANHDIFAWRVEDLAGIPAKKALHRLSVNPKIKPVKQKKTTFGPERNKLIKEEVDKLSSAGHIRPVRYPEWLSNVVLVKKSGNK